MWDDIQNIEKKSKQRSAVNILSRNGSHHAFTWPWNEADGEQKRSKIQAEEIKKNCQET
jgi:hypothetical protein